MHKVVYNRCYGGFELSKEARKMLAELKGISPDKIDADAIPRHDKDLITVVETLGDKANTTVSKLDIEEIESSTYRITEYDGYETVQESDDIDWTTID